MRRFAAMMHKRGHEVILYSGDRNETSCSEHVPLISEAERKRHVGDAHYSAAPWHGPLVDAFNARAILAIRKRLKSQDFILTIAGLAQKPIADAIPEVQTVEFGIGYPAPFSAYRVYESYAWMHTVLGAQAGNPASADGRFYDAVIPNQVDDGLYNLGKGDGGYALFVGRLIDRKGYRIAQEACERAGVRLILAGPGEPSGYGEFVGEVGEATRARLMEDAMALFLPTIYVEPFGSVVIEALACGTPVITTDWGAMTETVRHGVNGFRCHLLRDFVEALDRAPGLDRAAIRRDALARYSTDAVAPQYEAYFDRLLTLYGEGWYADCNSDKRKDAA